MDEEARKIIRDLFEQCVMTHKHWGENNNTKEADAAIDAARDFLTEHEYRSERDTRQPWHSSRAETKCVLCGQKTVGPCYCGATPMNREQAQGRVKRSILTIGESEKLLNTYSWDRCDGCGESNPNKQWSNRCDTCRKKFLKDIDPTCVLCEFGEEHEH